MSEAIAPGIRESFAAVNSAQTTEIRKMITHHQEDMGNIVHEHEGRDERQFKQIQDRLDLGERRMGRIERKIAYAAGFIAAVPILWDLFKAHFLK